MGLQSALSREVKVGHRELLSLKEVVILAQIPEARLRKDVETGLLEPYLVRGEDSRLLVRWAHVPALTAVYGNECIPASLRRLSLDRLQALAADISAHKGRTPGAAIAAAGRATPQVHVDRFLAIDLAAACDAVGPRLDLYLAGLGRIEERRDIHGGEAVFGNSRLPVAHVGKMFDRGESAANILQDYPYLTEADIHFARLYYLAHPPVGRPRMSDGRPDEAEIAAR